MTNALYYGDNLPVLRESIKDESVDLIYLDPPFNSNASYNVLFKAPSGEGSQAQIEVFEDTWHWNEHAERAFDDVMRSGNSEAANMLNAMRSFLGENDMMAYLAMMAVRLIELHRVLKPSGSLYIHCDPTASHYLKILLDAVFGSKHFRSEIIWRRSAAHNKLSKQYGPIHDTILFYSRGDTFIFHPAHTPYNRHYIATMFKKQDAGGRYRMNELTGQATRTGDSGKPWLGYDPTPRGRHWAIPASLRENLPKNGKGMTTQEMLDVLNKKGWIVRSDDGRPSYKQYPGEGVPYQDIWSYQSGTEGTLEGTEDGIDADVKWLDSEDERLGYPTQKPVGLLERIIKTSANEDALILDPFCGCGTTVHAAQKLGRRWIGIDITHLAIGLIERRLKDAFPGIKFEVHGTPKDFAGAEDLAKRDKFQFQWWAVTLINAVPYGGKKKGPDSGIDGYYYCKPDGKKTQAGIVSVKGGETIHRNAVGELRGVVERDKAPLGVLITLREPTGPMIAEAAAAKFFDTPFGKFPRLQIATVGDLLKGKLPRLPPQEIGGGYKLAPKEATGKQEKLI